MPANMEVFDDIQAQIINGSYAVGSKLPPERDLSVRYNVSRFAIREAMARLTQLGLIETRPQSGNYVLDFEHDGNLELAIFNQTSEMADSIKEFRSIIEIKALRQALTNITEDDIERLKTFLSEIAKNGHDVKKLAQADFNFHLEIVKCSTNLVFPLVLNSLKPIYLELDLFKQDDAPRKLLRLNMKLLAAIAEGDCDEAELILHSIIG